MAYQHDLCFICVCVYVKMCVWIYACARLCVKHQQSVILRKLTLSKLQTQTQHFSLPDKTLCLTSRFHGLHHCISLAYISQCGVTDKIYLICVIRMIFYSL